MKTLITNEITVNNEFTMKKSLFLIYSALINIAVYYVIIAIVMQYSLNDTVLLAALILNTIVGLILNIMMWQAAPQMKLNRWWILVTLLGSLFMVIVATIKYNQAKNNLAVV